MIIKLYVDVFPGCSVEHLFFTARPGEKLPGAKRLCVDIKIPDRLINKVDGYLPSGTAISEDTPIDQLMLMEKFVVDPSTLKCSDCIYEKTGSLNDPCRNCIKTKSSSCYLYYQLANPPEDTRSPFIPPIPIEVEPIHSSLVGERQINGASYLPPGPFPEERHACEFAKNGKCINGDGGLCPHSEQHVYRESFCLFLK